MTSAEAAHKDVAQLAHVELLSPDPDATLSFFKDLLGMQESDRAEQSVYLRAYEDHYHHTLKITEAAEPGLGHIAWRTSSAEALQRCAERLEGDELSTGFSDGDIGHGPALRVRTPDGHPMELFWEAERATVPAEQRTSLLNRPQRRPAQGVPVRRIDHVNCYAQDVAAQESFFTDRLGFTVTEKIVTDERDDTLATWLHVTNLSHDIAFFKDPTGSRGRFHHVAYFYGSPQHLSDVVELLREDGRAELEAGPGKHGISQGNYLYVFEPGGNRVELWGDAGLLIFDPDWEPVVWTPGSGAMGPGGSWVGDPIVETFFHRGSPDVPVPEGAPSAGPV